MGKGQSKLTNESITDLQKSTYFEKKEIQQWFTNFQKGYPQGVLKREDFQQIYLQFFPFGDPTDFASRVFEMYDANHSGEVDFVEFVRGLSLTARGRLDEKLYWAFKFYDVDGDNLVSHKDMLTIMQAIYKLVGNMITLPPDEDTAEKKADKVFAIMDKRGEGGVTLEEFKENAKFDPMIVQGLVLFDGLM